LIFPDIFREALFRFLIRVAYLNTNINASEQNYSLLIHTSGRQDDHVVDYKQVVKIFEALRDDKNKNYEIYYKRLWDLAVEMYPAKS